jgi:phenylalanyl-tRNA synthetase alpha subunit
MSGELIDKSIITYNCHMQNLKKTASMVDGQVGYHRPENVRRCKIAKNNTIVRQLEKTKRELHPDLAKEQQDRLNEIQKQKKAQRILEEKQKKMEALERKREQEARSYDRIMGEDMMTSNSGELLCFNADILLVP